MSALMLVAMNEDGAWQAVAMPSASERIPATPAVRAYLDPAIEVLCACGGGRCLVAIPPELVEHPG